MAPWGFWAATVLALVAGQIPARADNLETRVIADGLVFERAKIAGDKFTFILRVSLEKFNLRVLTPLVPILGNTQNAGEVPRNPERTARGLFLEDYRRRYKAAAVMSGGYIRTFSPPAPLGLVKSDGVLTNAPHNSWLMEGVLCSDEGRVQITIKDHGADQSEFRDCLQAGPILLINGTPPTNIPSRRTAGYRNLVRSVQEQTFVCIDDAGKVLLGVTEKINIRTLLDVLRRPEFACVDAMRLTGQETSGLRVNKELYGKDEYLFPSALAVISRRP